MFDALIKKSRSLTGAEPLNQTNRNSQKFANLDADLINQAIEEIAEPQSDGGQKKTKFHNKLARQLDILTQFPSHQKNTRIHNKTIAFGKNVKRNNHRKSKICHCCGVCIEKNIYGMGLKTTPDNIWPEWLRLFFGSSDTVEINERTIRKKIFSLDPGIAMYFSFIKMVIIYFICRFLIIDGYNLVTNILSMSSEQVPPMVIYSSFFKSFGHLQYAFNTEDLLNLILIAFSIGYFNIYRWMLYRMENYNDFIEPDHFTILVENIPIILPEDSEEINQNGRRNKSTPFNYKQILDNYFTRKIVENFFYCEEFMDLNQFQDVRKQIIQDFNTTLEIQREIGLNMNRQGVSIVSSVSPCYSLEEIQNIQILREKLIKSYEEKTDAERRADTKTLKHIKLLNDRQITYGQNLQTHQIDWHLSHFTGKAFVTFEYAHFKNFILEDFHKVKGSEIEDNFKACVEDFLKTKYHNSLPMPKYERKNRYTLYESQLNIKSAQKPQEINWRHLVISAETRKNLIFVSFGYLVLMLGTIFALLVGIQSFQLIFVKEYQNQKTNVFVRVLSTLLPTIFIKALNFLVSAIVERLTKEEKHENLSEYNVSLIFKIVLAQYINTAFLYLLIGLLMPDNQLITENGIINKLTMMIISYGFIEIATNLININFITYFWRNLRVKPIENMFQQTLNKQLQIPSFDFTQRYSYYLLHTLMVSLYCTLSPITVPFLIFVFIVQFWIDKFYIFKVSSNFIGLDFKLSKLVFKFFQISLIVYSNGYCIAIWLLRQNGLNLFQILLLIFCTVYVMVSYYLPKSWERRLFLNEQKFLTKHTYSACLSQKLFTSTYWNENPLTKYLPERLTARSSSLRSNSDDEVYQDDPINDVPSKVINDFEEEIIEITSRKYMTNMFDKLLGMRYESIILMKAEEVDQNYQLKTNISRTQSNTFNLLCPNNHRLIMNKLWKNQLYALCKICRKRIEKRGEKEFCCRICNYDICCECGERNKEKLTDPNFNKGLIVSKLSNKINKTTTVIEDLALPLKLNKHLSEIEHIIEENESPLRETAKKNISQSLIAKKCPNNHQLTSELIDTNHSKTCTLCDSRIYNTICFSCHCHFTLCQNCINKSQDQINFVRKALMGILKNIETSKNF